VPLASIVEEYKALPPEQRRRRAMRDPTLEVLSPQPRCSTMRKPQHDPLLFGCSAEKKNICRFQLLPARKRLLDSLCQRLSLWVDSLGKAFSPCEHMILLRGTGPRAEDRRDVPVLLVDCRYRPKMQYLGGCTLEGASAADPLVLPEELPVLLRYNVVASPLNRISEALECISSDDLCFKLSALDLEWKVFSLAWRWPEAADNLLLMEITAVGEEVAKLEAQPASKWRQSGKDRASWSAMDLGDPMALPEGIAGHHLRIAGGGGGSDEAGPDGDHLDVWGPLAGDEELLEHLRPDEIDVVAEELGIAMGHGLVPSDTVGPEDVEAESASEQEDEGGEPAAAAPVEATPSVEECIQAAITSPLGYISCPLGQYQEVPCIGRLTTWPASEPMRSRNVSVRCYLHPACSCPARRRHAISDDVLYRWLFAGVYERGASRARLQELCRLHRAAFAGIVSVGAAGAGAASSSGAPPPPAL
jgi:hypothetical protein